MIKTDNYKKHTSGNPLQKFLIDKFFECLMREAKKLKVESVLDAGCGEGFTLEKLRVNKIGHDLSGIDFYDKAIKIGKKLHPSLHLKEGSIYQMPYSARSFDLVICTEVLEHLEDPEKALKELERVCKKYCMISVPHEPWFMLANLIRGKNISRLGNDIEHIQHWSKNGIVSLINKHFRIKSVRSPFPWTLVVANKKL